MANSKTVIRGTAEASTSCCRFARSGKGVYPFGTDFLKIEVRSTVNDETEAVPLEVTATFDTLEVERPRPSGKAAGVQRYIIGLRWCRLTYHLQGCSIPSSSLYEYVLQDGAIEKITSSKISVEGSADADTRKFHSPLSLFGRITAAAKTSKEVRANVKLVAAIPNGWHIGIRDVGDPLQIDNQYCLFSRYFVQDYNPEKGSCVMEFAGGVDRAKLTFSVNANDGLYVERLTAAGSRVSDVFSSERDGVIEYMKSKLAGIVVEKAKPYQLPLAQETYVANRLTTKKR